MKNESHELDDFLLDVRRDVRVCIECGQLSHSISDLKNRRGQLVCRMTYDPEQKYPIPPKEDLSLEKLSADQVVLYEQRFIPKKCVRRELYKTIFKLGVL